MEVVCFHNAVEIKPNINHPYHPQNQTIRGQGALQLQMEAEVQNFGPNHRLYGRILQKSNPCKDQFKERTRNKWLQLNVF